MVIAFASIFLGLVMGVQPVKLLVGEEVAEVRIYLDGKLQDRLEGRPWTSRIDLGVALRPRRLEAVAVDESGTELGRAAQWVNMPRPPAAAEMVLEPDPEGQHSVARMSWESIRGQDPTRVSVVFDGQPLEVADPRLIELPPHDPEQLHFLQAELTFSENISSVIEATFGGSYGDDTITELTGVAVEVDRRGRNQLGLGEKEWLTRDGRPLRLVAVDDGPADIIIVRDASAQGDLDRLPRRRPVRLQLDTRFVGQLKGDHRVRLMSPFPKLVPRADFTVQLFEPTEALTREIGGMYYILSRFRPRETDLSKMRLADAVAVAGMTAAQGSRRRVVVLVLGESPQDAAQLAPATVRSYLESLRVPLVVWQTNPAIDVSAWGDATRIDTISRLDGATNGLGKLLDKQRILWVEGQHLPTEIQISESTQGLKPAG